jgi:hypothetical protein
MKFLIPFLALIVGGCASKSDSFMVRTTTPSGYSYDVYQMPTGKYYLLDMRGNRIDPK